MKCSAWQPILEARSIDEMPRSQREELLAHLLSCPTCRRAAVEADPTVAFSLLPSTTVEKQEVEEIQRTVEAMRRVRILERPWPQRTKRRLAAGALAATVLVAVLLVSRTGVEETRPEVPFAGAVGVGSGLVNVPEKTESVVSFTLHLELARSPKQQETLSGSVLTRISQVEVRAKAGDLVQRDLGDGYLVRFHLPEALPGGELALEDLELTRTGPEGTQLLLQADLQPLGGSPLIVGVEPPGDAESQLWLLLSSSTKDRSAAL